MVKDNLMFYITLVNGKYGYGKSSWDALVDAVGERKADKIAAQIKHISEITGTIYAINGVVIGAMEKYYA
jgi:hypothetical protein